MESVIVVSVLTVPCKFRQESKPSKIFGTEDSLVESSSGNIGAMQCKSIGILSLSWQEELDCKQERFGTLPLTDRASLVFLAA